MQTLLKKLQEWDNRLPQITGFDTVTAALRNNAQLLLYLVVVGILAYAADIFTFSLNIDSENHAYGFGAKGGWVSQGRWGMYLLNEILLPDAIMPVIPNLIAVLGTVLGAVFFVHTLSPTRGIADYLAAPITIACPIIYFAFYFTTLGYGLGVAFAATSYGVYLLSRGTWKVAAAAIPFFCFGIAVYQAVLPLIVVMFSLFVVALIMRDPAITMRTVIRHCLQFTVALIFGYVLCVAISKAMLAYINIPFDTGYISNFMNYQLSWEYFSQALDKTWPIAVNYFTGGKDYYLYDLVSLKGLFYFSLIIALVRILTAGSAWYLRVFAVLLLFAALVAPMVMHLMNNGYMPPRTVLGVPQVLAALVFFAASSKSKLVRSVTAVLAVACLYNFCVVNNRYAFSNYMTWQADRELSVKIQQRIAEVLPRVDSTSNIDNVYAIEIVGWVERPETPIFIQREVIGASFYKWAAGDVERTALLFRTMGVTRYRAATKAERLTVVEKTKTMPSWPFPGSVDVINGIIVIKFREYNPNQFLAMCQPPLNTDPVCVANMPQ